MADKVQKIREWVKARLDENTSKQSLPQFYGMMEEDARFLDFLDSLQDKPVSENLEEEIERFNSQPESNHYKQTARHFANWQKGQMMKNIWKPTDGDDLPEYEREVVVFTQNFPNDAGIMSVAIAHRPNPNGWDGKSLSIGKVEHYTPKTYDKGGWNIPDVKYWLDVELPKEIEL